MFGQVDAENETPNKTGNPPAFYPERFGIKEDAELFNFDGSIHVDLKAVRRKDRTLFEATQGMTRRQLVDNYACHDFKHTFEDTRFTELYPPEQADLPGGQPREEGVRARLFTESIYAVHTYIQADPNLVEGINIAEWDFNIEVNREVLRAINIDPRGPLDSATPALPLS